jgi:hypothetical protein
VRRKEIDETYIDIGGGIAGVAGVVVVVSAARIAVAPKRFCKIVDWGCSASFVASLTRVRDGSNFPESTQNHSLQWLVANPIVPY